MTFRDYLLALGKHWLSIVLLAAAGGVIGFLYVQSEPSTYRAEASVIVVPTRGDSTSELVQGSSYVQNLVQTYAVVAKSPVVLEPVMTRLGLEETASSLSARITIETPLDTAVLEIGVVGTDRDLVAPIANAVAAQLADAVESLAPQTVETSEPAVRLQTISPASAPASASGPNTRLFVAAGIAAGVLAGMVYALVRRFFATRLVSREDVAALTEIPVLGEVAMAAQGVSLPEAVREASGSAAAESVRSVAAGLRFANVDTEAKVILVTSATSGEGKSSIALATAMILAEQGQRVLLVDADLRRGSIARLTGLEGSVGVTTVLVGDATLEDATQNGPNGLTILTSGAIPPNPGQLLASDHLRSLIATAREQFDVVLIDSPPVLAVSDPLWLARVVDGIIVVARYRRTKRDALARTLDQIEAARTRVLGIVLNAVKRGESSPYYSQPSRKRPVRSRVLTGGPDRVWTRRKARH